ncbi:MAG: hypothetical protein COX39_00025 [Candidatus Nealsonbacteria bacterium CG23_combo_of_CG06-09_8_20_14_all_40_13]|uniref:Uncharacterized protein n=1 Tax=Candidatus Nealsonbacteria bacterium CG23_combo_of_CG06-09_8_20_14_all_40_13 TaxID=1974724 RepID=A0A2G9YRW3_9BACT|nr:MAG: hypothetical protein COX39_00025 [Candidatus Nealsonbacteria bacterium CG23_combo_of_CG06-09_8_20_14_all_40_13]PIR71242.1 MAG: hypothetical protein COU44_00620 [Candidatus Nealsonbacteria bacterium CG10_big_fil_rev_8_21_14_0_10_40_24]PIU43552.1 MAG: hypothetical protein COS97_00510 [Candidatus Nealsonbacteria bacterium CG07_land_8_20_14_0_80_40_10]
MGRRRRNSRKRWYQSVDGLDPYSKTPDYLSRKRKKKAKKHFQPTRFSLSNGLSIRVEEGDNTNNGRAVQLNIQWQEVPFWQFWARLRTPLQIHLNEGNARRLARVLARIVNR